MNEELMIKVPQSRYNKLISDQEKLNKLYAAGVDNWDGFDFVFESDEEDSND